jgi:cytochrome P450
MATITPQDLTDELIRLDDPSFFIEDPFPAYERMRSERPVYWYEPLRLWAVTRYDDIARISRNPMIFSSEQGFVINDLKYGQSMVKSLFPPGAERLMASDPPRHRILRRMLGVSFGAEGVAALEQQVREIAAGLLDELPLGEEIEFVSRIAAAFPMMVLRAFIGISADRVEDLETGAGATTTRHLLTGALIALADHPAEYARLRADPVGLAESATEEFLRWVTPAIGFVRTALTDTMLSGQRILAGERVLMLYPAGNRDPSIWPDAERFDISRPLTQPHLAFGVGEHTCLGAALARLEIRIFWEEFARRFAAIEVCGEPRRQRTTLFTAWEELRVIFGPA